MFRRWKTGIALAFVVASVLAVCRAPAGTPIAAGVAVDDERSMLLEERRQLESRTAGGPAPRE